jgi:hypothetical protein
MGAGWTFDYRRAPSCAAMASLAGLALALLLAAVLAPGAPSATASRTSPPPRVVKVLDQGGFDWGDAAIGAGAGIGLVLLLTGLRKS